MRAPTHRFRANWDGAKAAGIEPGAYHFFTPVSIGRRSGRQLPRVDARPIADALAPAVDLDFDGNCSRRPDGSVLRRELLTFVRTVESSTGQRVVLYLGDDVDERYHVTAAVDRDIGRATSCADPR